MENGQAERVSPKPVTPILKSGRRIGMKLHEDAERKHNGRNDKVPLEIETMQRKT